MKKILLCLMPVYALLVIVYLILRDNEVDIARLNEKIKDYELVCDFYEDRAVVKKDKKIGFIDKKGELVIPFKWECNDDFLLQYETKFEEGRCLIHPSKGNDVLIDKDGNELYSGRSISIKKIGDKSLLFIDDGDSKKSSYWMDKKSITRIEEVEGDELITTYNYNYNSPERFRTCYFTLENLCDGKIVGKQRLSKEFGYQYVRSYHCPIENEGDGFGLVTLLNEKTNKYGIVDQKGNIVVPFEYNNAIAMFYGLLIEIITFTKDADFGQETYPLYCNVYKDGRLLQEKLPFYLEDCAYMGMFLFLGDSISNIRDKYILYDDEFEIPASVETSVLIDVEGNKVSRFAFGKNYLRYTEDKTYGCKWQLEDEDGNLVYPYKFWLKSRLKNGIEIETCKPYNNLYLTDAGDTISSAFMSYLYYDVIKMTDKIPLDYYPLCDYNLALSEKDNYLNSHHYRFYESKKGPNYDVIKLDGIKLTSYSVDEVSHFSDGLLRLRLNNRYFFIDEEGNGMISAD